MPQLNNLLKGIGRSSLVFLGPGLIGWLSGLYWRATIAVRAIWNSHYGLYKQLTGVNWKPPPHLYEFWQYQYEVSVAPARARHLRWVYKAIALVFQGCRIKFVVNVFPGMGHNTVELDYFMRRRLLNEWPPGTRFVLLRRPSAIHDATYDLYRQHFWWMPRSTFIYNLLLPILMGNRFITVDCGLSRLKWQLREDCTWDVPPNGQSFLYQINKDQGMRAWEHYYQVRARTLNAAPLSENIGIDAELRDFLGGSTEKLALVHIKLHVANATAAETDPASYLDALRFLRDAGYRLVFVGREDMPDSFKELGLLNYAQSPIASYKRDLQIFSVSSIAITAGSGIALMPDCMNVPLVYLDSWHIGMPLFSEKCISVPTLVKSRATGAFLSLAEQIALYRALPDNGDEVFPIRDWEPRSVTADEVLAAVQEALSPSVPPTARQQALHAILPGSLLDLAQSRISRYFIEKHQGLLPDIAVVEPGPTVDIRVAAQAAPVENVRVAPDNIPSPPIAAPTDAPAAPERTEFVAPNAPPPSPVLVDPSPWQRLSLLPQKIRENGYPWFAERLRDSCRRALNRRTLGLLYRRVRGVVLRPLTLYLGEFRRNNPDSLHVYYDLDLYPISFDVGYFLIWADLQRRRLKLSSLHVVFVPVENEALRKFPSGYAEVVDGISRQWRFRNIAIPLTTLLDSSVGVTVCASRSQADAIKLTARHNFPAPRGLLSRPVGLASMYRDIIAGFRPGEESDGLRASPQGIRYVRQWVAANCQGKRLIVVTLRQYGVDMRRNNDMKAWLAFARSLPASQYAVVFVPDTDHALDQSRHSLDGFHVFDAAAWNVEIRMALYQEAYLNMTVNTGPATLCVLGRQCRYLMFKVVVPDVYLASEQVLLEYGFKKNENPPFAGPFQKWVWDVDSYDVLKREFEAMVALIEQGSDEHVI